MRGDEEAAGVLWDQRGWPAHPRQGAGGRSAGGASARKRLRAVDPPKGARDLVASIPQGVGRSPPGTMQRQGLGPGLVEPRHRSSVNKLSG